ncbi:MAG: dimethylmenaquinone methyltransferase [Propionibacteriaceae bacterium]|nr:dimethylmenaquinone methyltransferase [Propionibacteriaceae bacterium]
MTDTAPEFITSATAHEAAGRIGALPSAIKPLSPAMRLTAPAFPVSMPAGDNLWIHRAVYAAEPGDVLVVAANDGFEYGYWGEILTVAAQARGLAGLVIAGGVRDSERLIEIGWPVFSERVCIRGTVKDPDGIGSLGQPITVGDVTINRRDLVIGDCDGLVVIPAARVEEVNQHSIERETAEAGYMDRLRAGESTLSIYHLP